MRRSSEKVYLAFGLNERNITQGHAFLGGDLPLLLQVNFVAYDKLLGLFPHVLFDLLKPDLDVIERTPICDVVGDDDAVCSSIITAGDGFEPILSSGVPLLRTQFTTCSLTVRPLKLRNLIF